MELLEIPSQVPAADPDLIRLAVALGADPSAAPDMVAAVFSYCHRRHGSSCLSRAYLRFLTARAVIPAAGEQAAGAEALLDRTDVCPSEILLIRALAVSQDPAELYEMYRRALLYPDETGLAAAGVALRLDLRRIVMTPGSDQVLVWNSAGDRLVRRAMDWLEANRSLGLLLVHDHPSSLTPSVERRAYLVDRLVREGQRRSVPAVEVQWLAAEKAKRPRRSQK